jgi:hypothetical protein
MEQTLEHKVVRATTMLANAAEEWRGQVGRARGALARARAGSAPAGESSGEAPSLLRVAPDLVDVEDAVGRE